MSRDPYGGGANVSGGGSNRSPRTARRELRGELPTVDRSPSRTYPSSYSQPGSARGSPIIRKGRQHVSRSSNSSPLNFPGHHAEYPMSTSYGGGTGGHHSSTYYGDDLGSPMMDSDRRSGAVPGTGHHRSRSTSRSAALGRYQSLERDPHDREFIPIREPRERSLDRGMDMSLHRRDRSLDRGMYRDTMMEDDLYAPRDTHGMSRSARQSPNPDMSMKHSMRGTDGYIMELQHQNTELQKELGNLKKELEMTSQKLGSSMHSIKTFWSPELKKERALRKEESAKYSLINDQLKLLNSENQKQAMLVRQLEEELRMRMRNPSVEMQQQMEALFAENDHLTREIAILRETIKELELRIDTQKQTLQARDESIKKLLEMLQNKGIGKEEERQMFQQMQALAQKQLEEYRAEIQRRDQEILAMSAKMKTLEEQHQDYQRHIAVLKESLCAKEEHYNMLQADVEELRQRLEEKNRHIEKKTQTAIQATQDRNRLNNELNELRDHMDIKDRKINVLQRKLDLQEANQKLANGAARSGEEAQVLRKQLEEQMKHLEDQKRKVDESRKGLDSKVRQLEEKEKALNDADQKLKRRREKLDQMEAQIQKNAAAAAGQTPAAGGSAEIQKKLAELEGYKKELDKAKEESKRAQGEMERLLQLVQMSQEEQNSKEKMIMDLQNALKDAQSKLRSIQSAGAQMGREEVEVKEIAVEAVDIQLEELVKEVQTRDDEISKMNGDINSKQSRILELEQELHTLEDALRNHEKIEELEQLVNVVKQKNDRIEELEEALRESVKITAEREMVLHEEEKKRKEITEKVGKLEQRLMSLQAAHALRCSTCRPLVARLQGLEERLTGLLAERRTHLQDLSRMKQEALEAAISEKDAHLALLEVSGIRTARQAEEVDQLRADRRRLMERLRKENEQSMKLIQDYSVPEPVSLSTSLIDVDDEEAGKSGEEAKRNEKEPTENGHQVGNQEVEPDSLEASFSSLN